MLSPGATPGNPTVRWARSAAPARFVPGCAPLPRNAPALNGYVMAAKLVNELVEAADDNNGPRPSPATAAPIFFVLIYAETATMPKVLRACWVDPLEEGRSLA